MSYALVYITASDIEEARKIGENLVKKRLAACVNIVPRIISCYWWQGDLHQDEEALILAKTESRLVEKVIAEVKTSHSYQLPDISVLEIKSGDPDFLRWVSQEVSAG